MSTSDSARRVAGSAPFAGWMDQLIEPGEEDGASQIAFAAITCWAAVALVLALLGFGLEAIFTTTG